MNEPRFFRELDMEDVADVPFAAGRVVCFSHRCPEKSSANEDALALIPRGNGAGVLVVADGLGGLPFGGAASSIAVEALARSIGEAPADALSLRGAILDGIENANRMLLADSAAGATTIAVVELSAGTLRTYHVGDSIVLVMGQRGRIKARTEAHSPVGYAVSAGMLDEREAMHHEERHLVSNVVGSPLMRIEIGPTIAFGKRDTLILASDGLTDNLYEQEIVERVRKGELSAGVRRLVKDCRRRMSEPKEGRPCKPDDISVIAFRS